jgi:hypothetical protein
VRCPATAWTTTATVGGGNSWRSVAECVQGACQDECCRLWTVHNLGIDKCRASALLVSQGSCTRTDKQHLHAAIQGIAQGIVSGCCWICVPSYVNLDNLPCTVPLLVHDP